MVVGERVGHLDVQPRQPRRTDGRGHCVAGECVVEAEAAAVDSLDDPLVPPIVADGAPDVADATRQRGLAHEPVAPDLIEQLDLRHQPIAMHDQMDEHVENLRLERTGTPPRRSS